MAQASLSTGSPGGPGQSLDRFPVSPSLTFFRIKSGMTIAWIPE
jgi:hypothetical protein